MKTFILNVALAAWLLSPMTLTPAYAQEHDDHGHEESHKEGHQEGQTTHDEDEHNGHAGEADKHDDHDDHGHGDEEDEHEEGKVEILPSMAKQAGVSIEKAGSATIASVTPLTGRITVNENTKANVRARFAGIVRAVKANLGETVKKGQVLAVIESNESLQDYNVTSPINGVILERNTNIGDVANGEPLFMIADLSNVWAKFHVFPKDADSIKAGQNVRVHTLDESRARIAGIDMLFPTADALSQTLIAIVPLSNEQGLWRPGMTVEGDVKVSEKKVSLAVPTSALQTMDGQKVLFVKEGNSYAHVPVKTGVSDGEYVEIIHGLKAGQAYVSKGSFVIKADILKAGAEHAH